MPVVACPEHFGPKSSGKNPLQQTCDQNRETLWEHLCVLPRAKDPTDAKGPASNG